MRDMKVTDRLKTVLSDHGISQSAFAEAVSLRRETVNRWFSGDQTFNPEKETIDRILVFARSLDPEISYDSLFAAALPPAVNE